MVKASSVVCLSADFDDQFLFVYLKLIFFLEKKIINRKKNFLKGLFVNNKHKKLLAI